MFKDMEKEASLDEEMCWQSRHYRGYEGQVIAGLKIDYQ